jgi:hypothetical protein
MERTLNGAETPINFLNLYLRVQLIKISNIHAHDLQAMLCPNSDKKGVRKIDHQLASVIITYI